LRRLLAKASAGIAEHTALTIWIAVARWSALIDRVRAYAELLAGKLGAIVALGRARRVTRRAPLQTIPVGTGLETAGTLLDVGARSIGRTRKRAQTLGRSPRTPRRISLVEADQRIAAAL
jgi:hypothetical protein